MVLESVHSSSSHPPSPPTTTTTSLPRLSPMSSRGSNASSHHSTYDMSALPTPRSSGAYDAHDDDALVAIPNNGEFYNQVESFLNRPSPSLTKIAKGSKSTENLLPMLKAERTKLRVEKPTATSSASSAERPKQKKQSIDLSLVHQAFAYADELRCQQLQENDDDDDTIDNAMSQLHMSKQTKAEKSLQPPPAVTTRSSSSSSSKGKQPTSSKAKQVKKLSNTSAIYGEKPTPPPKRAGPNWDSCSKEPPPGTQHSSMDPQLVQQLLSNFQNGTTLNELRQELAASQASLKESRQVLQGAAKTFFMKGGG
ncbi:Aste57867_8179 [Aphanomyces stellatus]|uniref:Aste57867_8179 protein n=1 Tax=Aphanomyces stellatus TaxID=120398 RepID=A0A485KJL1_9STRA|nr:hypothetical protein As57867_008148 [Aphanomyces stellatus]VFT85067.1 Aste57867_8179 [Aphanomyces stellatus]